MQIVSMTVVEVVYFSTNVMCFFRKKKLSSYQKTKEEYEKRQAEYIQKKEVSIMLWVLGSAVFLDCFELG